MTPSDSKASPAMSAKVGGRSRLALIRVPRCPGTKREARGTVLSSSPCETSIARRRRISEAFQKSKALGEATLKIVIAAVAACLLGALAQSSPVQAFQSEETLRIGGLWAITGGVALTGKGALNLSRLAVEEINSAGGVRVGGKQVKLQLFAYDEACKPEEGLALANRLANVDKVLFSL